MTIDRLLIICSVIELSFIAYCDGPGCFNGFQWAAITLLSIKMVLAAHECRRRTVTVAAMGNEPAIQGSASVAEEGQ